MEIKIEAKEVTETVYTLELTERQYVAVMSSLGSTSYTEDKVAYEHSPLQEAFEDAQDFSQVVYDVYDAMSSSMV